MIEDTKLEGLKIVKLNVFHDHRGSFVKTFHENTFLSNGLETNFKECFYSMSKINVIRGMHFQIPPYDHSKLVFVPYGSIIDVVVDLRKKSPTFGMYFSIELSYENCLSIFIPSGFAHGFLTTSEQAVVVYSTSTVHNTNADSGIRWNSFEFDWEVKDPIVSERDSNFLPLSDFNSPF